MVLDTMLKWHPFPASLPLKNGKYLVQHGYGNGSVMTESIFDQRLGGFGFFLGEEWVRYNDVVAWMNKPDPYRESSEKMLQSEAQ